MEYEQVKPLQDVAPLLQGRNQFILGPTIPLEFEAWPRVAIGRTLSLAVHPSMDLTQTSRDGRRLTCIGFMLDPFHPQWIDADILNDLLDASPSRDILLERTARLGGRWVLIVEEGADIWLIHDTLGYRQVFFTDGRHAGDIWCASHPRVPAGILGVEMDPTGAGYIEDMLRLNPTNALKQRSRWWPGIGSPYPGIRRLTPNHILDLNAREQRRFWPVGPVAAVSFDEAVEEGAVILEGMILAARARFDELSLMITAGLDSRLVLAACRPIAGELRYVTLDYPRGLYEDVTVPVNLLPRLGLEHDVARATTLPTAEFLQMYRPNIVMPNNFYAANAEALLPFFQQRRAVLNGVATGVFTGHYRLPRPADLFIKQVTPALLTRMLPELENHPFATRAFQEWFDTLGDTYNHDILDLFFWEQRTPNWNSDWALGYDIIWKDAVMPFNSRYLYELFIGVAEPLRRKPGAALHRAIMRKLWPEVLDLADNPPPPSFSGRIKQGLLSTRKRLRQNLQVLR